MKKTAFILFMVLACGLFPGSALAADTANIDIHGFISQGFIKTTENNFFGETEDGSFEFNEFGINFANELTDDLRVGLQILARDFGANGNNEMVIDWAFGDYHWKDWLGFRAGKLKTPKGFYNETRDVDMLRTSIFLPQSVYPEILRDMDLGLLGMGAYGHLGLNWFGSISYQFMYGTQNVEANEAASQALQATTAYETPIQNNSIDVDSKYSIGMVWDTPLNGLRVGATYDCSELLAIALVLGDAIPDTEEGDLVYSDFKKFQNTVFSIEYTIGDLLLSGEYIRTYRDFGIGFKEMPSLYSEVTSDGWYMAASYQFTDWLALGGYYSESYNDKTDRDGDFAQENRPGNNIAHRAYFEDICFTASFMINANWTIKVEDHLFTGTNGVSPIDQVADSNGNVFAEEDWNLLAIKTTFSF
jgi:hypothetical protein